MPRLAAVLALVIALVVIALVPVRACAQDVPVPGDIVVNEILYDAPTGSEYVELVNRSQKTIRLADLVYADERRSYRAVTTDAALTLAPGGFVVLVDDPAAFAAQFPGVAFLDPPGWSTLNNGGDTAVVGYDDGTGAITDLDAVPYRPSWGGGDDVALERVDPFGPSDDPANFGTTADPRGGTPGAANSIFDTDDTPPALDAAVPAPDGLALDALFSEPLAPASVQASDFEIEPAGAPAVAAVAVRRDTVRLTLTRALDPGAYTLVARDVSDPAGNVLAEGRAAFTFFRAAAPAPGDIVVNELLYAPASGGSEFIELLNRTSETFDLSTLRFADANGTFDPVTDAFAPLPPGGFVVLADDAAAVAAQFPGVPVLEPAGWDALNNSGDTVTLAFDPPDGGARVTLDAVPYQPSWGGASGVSLERIDPAGPSASPSNFGSSTDPRGGTPGARNALFDPDDDPPVPTFAEEVALDALDVFFAEPLDPASVQPADFALGDGRRPATATLGASDLGDGTRVRLAFAAPLGGLALTVTGVTDLTGNTLASATLLIAYQAGAGELLINEIMFDPLADDFDGLPNQPEYFELANRSGRGLSLRGLVRTDRPDETGEADTTALEAGRTVLPPDALAVVFAEPDETVDPATASALANAFPDIDFGAPTVVLVPLDASSLGLLNGGDLIRLETDAGTVLTETAYDPAWHDAALGDAKGVSLERVDPATPADTNANWTSSTAPRGGTPGLPNSVAPDPDARPLAAGDLAVNEILYDPLADAADGRPDQPEYVELANRTADALDLTGLVLTDVPDEAGEADTLRVATRPVTLPPGGFAVVFAQRDGTRTPATDSALARAFPDADLAAAGVVLLPLAAGSLGLLNGGDLVRVEAADGTVVTETFYDPGWHADALEDTKGVALARISLAAGDAAPTNWTSSVAPGGGTPGAPNRVALAPDAPAPTAGLTATPSPFSPDGDGFEDAVELRYALDADIALVRARIFDAYGRRVRTLEEAVLVGRTGSLVWDGRGDGGARLRIGVYVILFEAVSAEGGTVATFKEPVVLARPLD